MVSEAGLPRDVTWSLMNEAEVMGIDYCEKTITVKLAFGNSYFVDTDVLNPHASIISKIGLDRTPIVVQSLKGPLKIERIGSGEVVVTGRGVEYKCPGGIE